MLEGRNQVLPEDIQTILPCIVGHRLQPINDLVSSQTSLVQTLLESVPVP
jgi:hypothetical protein